MTKQPPELTQMDFCLCGTVKSKIYRKKPMNTNKLQENIQEVFHDLLKILCFKKCIDGVIERFQLYAR